MLQIKNTLGGGKPEGLYVWKKYEVIPAQYISNPSFTINAPIRGNASVHIKDSSFDLSNIPIVGSQGNPVGDLQSDDCKRFVDFFDGFRFDDTCYIEKSVYDASRGNSLLYHNNGNTWWLSGFLKSDSNYGFWFKTSTATGNLATLTYTGEKELVPAKVGELIGYVVSDKETAYPDGGEKGGYWYEKFSERITPELFGCTKMAIDEVTFSSRTLLSEVTFNHSLGEKPSHVIIVVETYPGSTFNDALKLMVYMNGPWFTVTTGRNDSMYSWTINATQLIYPTSGPPFYVNAGKKYKIITMV